MDELPTSFGKYYLTEKIATGGMAELFLAKLIGPGGFEKSLVIKQIHPELSGQAQFVDLFVAEAKTLVSLGHGNIVPVYELGVVGDTYFIAMEYIGGPTLREVQKALRRDDAHMEPARAAFVTAEILKGLDYAHRKGVIHRDLSPKNVMLSREGEIKLVDFGIALHEDQAESRGKLAGSYPYMSPEQVRGLPLTAASDLFSTGVLLWEMLTGRDLFARGDPAETLRAVESADIPAPSALRPGLPAALDAICARALRRDSGDRYAAAGDFLVELNQCLYTLGPSITSQSISELVAACCPPEVQRAAPARPADDPDSNPGDAEPATAPMDRTRPLPPGATGNKKRASTVRTFATRRQFQEVLARATPLLPMAAISGEQPTGAAEGSVAERRAAAGRFIDDPATRSRRGVPAVAAALVLALALVIALAVALAVALAPALRGTDNRTDTADPADPAGPADSAGLAHDVDAAPPASMAAPPDAAPAVAIADAGMAGAPRARAPRSPAIAEPARVSRPDAAPRPPAAPGTLKVGANPWGEVYADGKKLGRAPDAWPLPPGPHTIDVVFPVAGREQTRRFQVHIESGEVTSLGIVDFSGDSL